MAVYQEREKGEGEGSVQKGYQKARNTVGSATTLAADGHLKESTHHKRVDALQTPQPNKHSIPRHKHLPAPNLN